MKTFVYNKIEVLKTGRIATKRTPQGTISYMLYEIKSVDPLCTWTHWATESELLEVENDTVRN